MHPKMCLACNVEEVAGKYSKEDGTGFCSELCQYAQMQTSFREAVDEFLKCTFAAKAPSAQAIAVGTMSAIAEIFAASAREEDVRYWTIRLLTRTRN